MNENKKILVKCDYCNRQYQEKNMIIHFKEPYDLDYDSEIEYMCPKCANDEAKALQNR